MKKVDRFPSRSWAEIDLDALAHNIREIRRVTTERAHVMAVVKADAYGHGAVDVARVFLNNGASRLAVSMLDEALELRRHGIDAPILILGHTDLRRADEVIKYNLEQTVYSVEFARALSNRAVEAACKVNVHIKVDTGMNRLGFRTDKKAVRQIVEISKMQGLFLEGLFSHYAVADTSDDAYTLKQYTIFNAMIEQIENQGVYIPVKHICNSAGLLRFPQTHMNMVRAGLVAYGMMPEGMPSPYTDVDFRPAMTLKSSIVHLNTLPTGQSISYGRKFVTKRPSIIGTIPIGYADGYSRKLSGRAHAMIHGRKVPVVGSICMDMCMIDLTDLKESVEIGDEVVLFGRQMYNDSEFYLSVDDISQLSDTINYEITCLIGKRVPRVYIKDGQIIHMHSCIG